VRLVKMSFKPKEVDAFLDIFKASKDSIRAFEGCEYLELLQDENHSHVFITHSHWQTEQALDAYRGSELFQDTWKKTKALFLEKPEAWSTKSKHILS